MITFYDLSSPMEIILFFFLVYLLVSSLIQNLSYILKLLYRLWCKIDSWSIRRSDLLIFEATSGYRYKFLRFNALTAINSDLIKLNSITTNKISSSAFYIDKAGAITANAKNHTSNHD